ncbi:glycosyltransferase family 1 protein [Alicyclobacillus cycloheptanicus]|uniref:Glycosyltransferase involved in cell wall biosynthesis n=1 Tax=Alicyclobacillus cycloheptanicus TaxID=1457 RepID=A0ABT9XKN1_9BACL|nr:glycosyltransferase family 1 protein [Alicyclobacillus cycloheptanicus]MDQ0190854.1 glycosyltransferase involved in cell wall biosynthesis [Alicyclobacillus cycloheptanicus]WDM01449.1 glycosyltransferase family 1 protein [Alicyclobacillus cycloheptanicus]
MRIAMITETFLPGTDGIVTRLCATLRHLEQTEHEILLIAPEGGITAYASATVVGMPTFRFFLYPDKNFALPRMRIGKVLREFQPDLVHVVNPAFLGLAGIYYAWRYQFPLIASYHTNVPAYARHYRLDFLEPALWWFFRTLHNRAEVNLCTSRATLADLEAHGFRNLALWERGVDVQLYRSAKRTTAMRERLLGAPDTGQKLLLYVGRVAPEKNIQNVRPCLDALPEAHFAIVGDGPHRAELEQVFAGTKTVFTGFLHGEELAEAYAAADGFIFPSTTETLGLVLFEAMATGIPVMAADSAPTREVLENGQAGFIFDPTDPLSMVETMKQMLYNQEKRKRVQERAREIADTLDWAGPTQQLIAEYERVYARRTARAGARIVGESR